MLLNFRQFITESAWGSSRGYEVPEDKEQQLYDFYMLSFLSNRIPKKGIKRDDNESQIEYALYEAKAALLPKLKKSMLSAMFFSIASEARHVIDLNKIEVIKDKLEEEMGSKYATAYTDFLSKYSMWAGAGAFQPPHRRSRKKYNPDSTYYNAYQGALSVGNKKLFIEASEFLFRNMDWNRGYGGESWAKICDGWLNLNEAESLNNMQVWIDHAYDLQHNNGSVFTKVRTYTKDGSFSWLEKALNYKKRIKELHEIIDRVSPKLKTLAARALKLGGRTVQDFKQEFIDHAEDLVPDFIMNWNKVALVNNFGTREQQVARMLINYYVGTDGQSVVDVVKPIIKWASEQIKDGQAIDQAKVLSMVANDIAYLNGDREDREFKSASVGKYTTNVTIQDFGFLPQVAGMLEIKKDDKEKSQDELFIQNNINQLFKLWKFAYGTKGTIKSKITRLLINWELMEGYNIPIHNMPEEMVSALMDNIPQFASTPSMGKKVFQQCMEDARVSVKGIKAIEQNYKNYVNHDLAITNFLKTIIISPWQVNLPEARFESELDIRAKVIEVLSTESNIKMHPDYFMSSDYFTLYPKITALTAYPERFAKVITLYTIHKLVSDSPEFKKQLIQRYGME